MRKRKSFRFANLTAADRDDSRPKSGLDAPRRGRATARIPGGPIMSPSQTDELLLRSRLNQRKPAVPRPDHRWRLARELAKAKRPVHFDPCVQQAAAFAKVLPLYDGSDASLVAFMCHWSTMLEAYQIYHQGGIRRLSWKRGSWPARRLRTSRSVAPWELILSKHTRRCFSTYRHLSPSLRPFNRSPLGAGSTRA